MQLPPPPVTLWSFWRELAVLALSYSVIIGFVMRAVVDRVFSSSYTRNKDFIIERHREWWVKRFDEYDETTKLVRVHATHMTALEQQLVAQADSVRQNSDEHHRQTTEALALVTSALTAVQREAQATAVAVGRIEGKIAGLRTERTRAADGFV